MKKKLLSLILAACLLLAPISATAELEELAPGTIMLSGGVYESTFIEFLKATSGPKIRHYDFLIHTRGGDAYSTIAIVNRMVEMQKTGVTFTTKVYGKAMSAGAYLFLMGDKRVVYEGSSLMFHTMLQQTNKYQEDAAEKDRQDSITMNHIKKMDSYIAKRFKEVVQCSESGASCDYWLYGEEDELKAQFMSATTAYNIGVATDFISVR
jgi:ATP-dependent protease ClpP protease subunit